MRLWNSPIHASNNVRIETEEYTRISSIQNKALTGELVINLYPKPRNNPVVFRQYEIVLPSQMNITQVIMPNSLKVKKEYINKSFYKITVLPKSKILIIKDPININLHFKVQAIKITNAYIMFIVPKLKNSQNQLKVLDPNNFILSNNISPGYSAIIIIKNSAILGEVAYISTIAQQLPPMLTSLFIYLLFKKLYQLLLIVVLSVLIIYNIVWIHQYQSK